MKKLLISLFISFFVIGTNVVMAKDETHFVEQVYLPQTRDISKISLFSVNETLEQRLKKAWENLDERIDVSDLDIYIDDSEIYRQIIFANPQYYYVKNGYGYSYDTSSGKIYAFVPKYSETDKTVIKNTMAAIDEATQEILLYINDNMSDFEKVMAVHDYMVQNYEYDTSLQNYTITIMTTKTGVCMSYAFAFSHLMNTLNIENMYVSSEAMNHAWNLVKIDGKWYHIDLTWDDPSPDHFSVVHHTYALLSTNAIQNLENPHYDFDLAGKVATSTLYDDAAWKSAPSSIVFLNGTNYWMSGKSLVSEFGDCIFTETHFPDLGWFMSGTSYIERFYGGLAEFNGKLYFNTDYAIYCYDPQADIVSVFKNIPYTGGLLIDKNVLKYALLFEDASMNTVYSVYGGSFKLGDTRIGTPYIKDNKVITKIYKENTDNLMVVSFGDNAYIKNIDKAGISSVDFDAQNSQSLFFWNNLMQPYKAKEILQK